MFRSLPVRVNLMTISAQDNEILFRVVSARAAVYNVVCVEPEGAVANDAPFLVPV